MDHGEGEDMVSLEVERGCDGPHQRVGRELRRSAAGVHEGSRCAGLRPRLKPRRGSAA
jgi:hypothetical protein